MMKENVPVLKCEKQTFQIMKQIPQNAGTHKYLYDANTLNCDIHLCITNYSLRSGSTST